MRTTTKTLVAFGAAVIAVIGATSPSMAGKYRTPTPQQAKFYEQLLKGQRPSTKKTLTAAQRSAAETATAAGKATVAGVAPAAAAAAPRSTAIYVSAHPDDFVLFMNPYRDVVASDVRVVFIFLTAGDAGLGKGPKSAPYYLARENGAIRAIRFMADAGSSSTADTRSTDVRYNGHSVQRWTYKNTTAIFLRLPDGAGEGSGYPVHNWASLMKLKTGEVGSIRAVDGSTTYSGWGDLVKTLGEIVRVQASGSSNVWFDTHEIDTAVNPGDHSDHVATGLAVAAVQPTFACTNLAYHVGYSTGGLVNLDLDDVENRAGAFANYTSGLAERGYPGVSWEPTHKSWLGGMVYRLVNGSGQACGF
jgi:hypothetical protein